MPIYSFICSCGEKSENYFGAKEEKSVTCKCGNQMDRDFRADFAGVGVIADDWGPGYNPGIAYHYKNKADLMREIYARGFEPSLHGSGLSKVHRPLYVDEKNHLEHLEKSGINKPTEVEINST